MSCVLASSASIVHLSGRAMSMATFTFLAIMAATATHTGRHILVIAGCHHLAPHANGGTCELSWSPQLLASAASTRVCVLASACDHGDKTEPARASCHRGIRLIVMPDGCANLDLPGIELMTAMATSLHLAAGLASSRHL